MNLCNSCSKKIIWAGQAFTRYICNICNAECIHSNTATPSICRRCSEEQNICQRCEGDIDE